MPMSKANRNRMARLHMALPSRATEPRKSTRELADATGLTVAQAGRLLTDMEGMCPSVNSILCKRGARTVRLWGESYRTASDIVAGHLPDGRALSTEQAVLSAGYRMGRSGGLHIGEEGPR